ncbi:hypothetical protein BJ165DRAFT_1534045 [Panaeolus papilionaceus]|nr:hypothetical protein BJ165DRAFT_1534045 [Panaeolus papilionaceus]
MGRKAKTNKVQKAKAAAPAVDAETTSVHPTASATTNATTTPAEPTMSSTATASAARRRPVPTGAAALQAASRTPLQPVDTNVDASANLPSVRPTAESVPPTTNQHVGQSGGAQPQPTSQANASSTTAPLTASGPATVPLAGSIAGSTAPLAPTTGDESSSLEEEVRLLRAEHDGLIRALASANTAPPPPAPAPAAPSASETDLIPRSRPLPVNRQVALGLSHDRGLYLRCRRVLRSCVSKVEEAYQVNWHDQPDEFIAKVKSLAKAKCPHLGRYRNGWATELLMCGSNKNKRRYDKILERDPDGAQRKAQVAARNARRASATSNSSSNDADDEHSTHEDNSDMQAVAGPSNASNGIDNTSELSEEDYAEMEIDTAGNEDAGEEEDEEVQPQREHRSSGRHNANKRPRI